MEAVEPAGIDGVFLLEERERALRWRLKKTDEDVRGMLAEHEAAEKDAAEGKAVQEGAVMDVRTAALLEARKRHVALVGMQRALREKIAEERGVAEMEGRRGSKSRGRTLKQMQKEHDRLERARIRREEGEEREQRKRKQAWMNALTEHTDRFRRYHRDVVRRGVRAVTKSLTKYHDDMSRNATRAERDAERARIQKLKDDDEEGYLELVKETKNTRLLELLHQTDSYLKELGAIVKDERAKTGEVEYEGDADAANSRPAKHRYYDIAHAIKEDITEQSSLMVGGKLKEYQLQGVQWMVSLYNNRLNGILADEMGLGKTIQTLGLITYLMEMKENAGPYLVIVPLSTMSNWEMEFARWAPAVRVIVFKGDSKTRRRIYETTIEKNKFNVCLATYEYVVRGKNYLKRVHWQHIIIDEGHRIKNHESKLSIVLHKDYTSRSRLLLTGTPLQNSLTELWALLNFLLPKVFKSAESFESWFAAPFAQMGVGNVATTEESAQLTEEESLLIIRRLHQVLRPFLLRRLKADVLRMGEQLPDKKEHIVICDMSAWQRAMYVKIVKSEPVLFTDRHGRQRYDKLSNPAMQLRKCVNHPYLFHQDHSAMVIDSSDLWRCAGKFDMLDACITKFLRGGHRILVFNQMTKVVDLQARLMRYRKIPFFRLDGSTSPDERKEMVSQFNSPESDVNVFLLTTRAGGLGVNLQTADTVIIFDSDWNPSMDQQAQDRAHRIGQQREVLILRMITAKSVEEDIIERASFKRGLEEKIIRAGMFDESSKDSERQAMLRELLRVQEANSDGEDEEEADAGGMPTDEEINRLLARSEEEFELFTSIDKERDGERGQRPKLFVEKEVPDFATKIPKDLLKKAKANAKGKGGLGEGGDVDLFAKPRRRTATKNVSYGLDSLSEKQYIKLMDDAEDGRFTSLSDGVRSVQGKKRGRGRPPKSVAEPEEDSDEDDEGDDEDEDVVMDDDDDDDDEEESNEEEEIAYDKDEDLQFSHKSGRESRREGKGSRSPDRDGLVKSVSDLGSKMNGKEKRKVHGVADCDESSGIPSSQSKERDALNEIAKRRRSATAPSSHGSPTADVVRKTPRAPRRRISSDTESSSDGQDANSPDVDEDAAVLGKDHGIRFIPKPLPRRDPILKRPSKQVTPSITRKHQPPTLSGTKSRKTTPLCMPGKDTPLPRVPSNENTRLEHAPLRAPSPTISPPGASTRREKTSIRASRSREDFPLPAVARASLAGRSSVPGRSTVPGRSAVPGRSPVPGRPAIPKSCPPLPRTMPAIIPSSAPAPLSKASPSSVPKSIPSVPKSVPSVIPPLSRTVSPGKRRHDPSGTDPAAMPVFRSKIPRLAESGNGIDQGSSHGVEDGELVEAAVAPFAAVPARSSAQASNDFCTQNTSDVDVEDGEIPEDEARQGSGAG